VESESLGFLCRVEDRGQRWPQHYEKETYLTSQSPWLQ
jgi:hypothetical protein